jgi:hypothetical protein
LDEGYVGTLVERGRSPYLEPDRRVASIRLAGITALMIPTGYM